MKFLAFVVGVLAFVGVTVVLTNEFHLGWMLSTGIGLAVFAVCMVKLGGK